MLRRPLPDRGSRDRIAHGRADARCQRLGDVVGDVGCADGELVATHEPNARAASSAVTWLSLTQRV
jgi:hypothetical protein